jgi:hypothetical protein
MGKQPLSDETIASLIELGEVLRRIDTRLRAEGIDLLKKDAPPSESAIVKE